MQSTIRNALKKQMASRMMSQDMQLEIVIDTDLRTELYRTKRNALDDTLMESVKREEKICKTENLFTFDQDSIDDAHSTMDQLEASIALISVPANRAVALNRVRSELENTSLLAIKVKNEVERTELKLGGDLEQMKAQLGREKEMRIKFEQEVADYESKTATQLANREPEIAALRVSRIFEQDGSGSFKRENWTFNR